MSQKKEKDEIEKFIDDVRSDETLKGAFDSEALSARVLNKAGKALESNLGSAIAVIAEQRSKAEENERQYFDRLEAYARRANCLNVKSSVKGFLIKKLDALYTTGEQETSTQN